MNKILRTDRPTDRPTNQPTDRQADSSIPPSNFVCGGIKMQFQGHKSFQGQRSRSQGHEICFLHIYQSCLTLYTKYQVNQVKTEGEVT